MTITDRKRNAQPTDSRQVGCGHFTVHQETIESVLEAMPEDEILNEAAEFFRMFCDPTRMKILHALFVAELCVCDISALLNVSQSAVSHQLNSLRQTNLVKYRREGKTVFYSLKDEHVKQIVDMGISHVSEK